MRYSGIAELSWKMCFLRSYSRFDLGFEVFVHDDFQGAEELSVLCRESKFRVRVAIGVDLLAMDNVHLAAFVEADGNFQNEKEVVAGTANTRHNLGDPLRFREGFVDCVAQFFDQAFKIIVQLQGSPAWSRPTGKVNSRIAVVSRQGQSRPHFITT